MQSKTCTADKAQFKLYDDSPNGGFSGYASTYGNYDRVNEAVANGAFKNLDDFVKSGFIAVGHDWSALPIATIAEAKSDEYGLWIKADFHSTPAAQEARQVLKERVERGKFAGLSIGYEINDSEPTDKGRILKDLTLYETSLVTVPANSLAGVTSAKNVKDTAHAAMSLDDHTEAALAAAKGLVERLRALHELKSQDNRKISAARRADLHELKGLIDELDVLTTPKATRDEANRAYARLMALALDIP